MKTGCVKHLSIRCGSGTRSVGSKLDSTSAIGQLKGDKRVPINAITSIGSEPVNRHKSNANVETDLKLKTSLPSANFSI